MGDDKWYQKLLRGVEENPAKFSAWRDTDGLLYKLVESKYDESPTSGHTGTYKTSSRLSERYYWPCIRADVARFVRRCSVCAAHKPSQEKPSDKMVPQVDRPWEMVSTDLMGPFPRSKHDNS